MKRRPCIRSPRPTQDDASPEQQAINILVSRLVARPGYVSLVAATDLCDRGPLAALALIPLLDYPDERVADLADKIIRRIDSKMSE